MSRVRPHAELRARLATIDIPRPFSIKGLCAELARRRGRPLHLHPLPDPGSADLPCGMWIATPAADHIFHARGASALHQQNIILHEVGHMLCEHTLDAADGGLAALLPDLDPGMVKRVLMRTRYSRPQEAEAETIAALIMREAGWSPDDGRPAGRVGDVHDMFDPIRRE